MKKKTTFSPLNKPPLPVAGHSLLLHMIDRIFFMMVLIGILSVLIGFTTLLWQIEITGKSPNALVFTIVTILFAVTLTWYWNKKMKVELENYKLGRKGEIEVAHILEGLRPYGYTPLHDVVCEKKNGKLFNIDHVLVGPKGIFAVETKTWRKVNRKDIITYRNHALFAGNRYCGQNSLTEASVHANWLEVLLKNRTGKTRPVVPIVTIPNWWIDKHATAQIKDDNGVLLLSPKAIGKYLACYENSLLDDEIKEVVHVISSYMYEQIERESKRK